MFGIASPWLACAHHAEAMQHLARLPRRATGPTSAPRLQPPGGRPARRHGPYSRHVATRSVHGSVVYLHGVGGARDMWWRPIREALGGLTVDFSAPTYDDVLTTSGSVHARRSVADSNGPSDRARLDYLTRQRRLTRMIDAVGESSTLTWPALLPHPSDIAERLPLTQMLRTPVFGLDQVGRYLDDEARRAAVLHRASLALLRAPRPRVVVAHSLGSLVAWDLLADPRIEMDLLVTLGSPLSQPAVEVEPLTFPYDRIGAWLNVVHLLDPVPAGRGLAASFPAACDLFLSPTTGWASPANAFSRLAAAVAGAATAHLDSTYLVSPTVHAAIREAMRTPATQVPIPEAVA